MDTTPSRAKLPYDPVTSLHLRSFDKLDKRQFIKTYIQDQKFHAGIYSADGKAYFSTWQDQKKSVAEELKAAEAPSQEDGFGTPVLKARVAKPADDCSAMPENPSDSESEKLKVPQKASRKNTQARGDLSKKGVTRKGPNSHKENKEVSQPPSQSISRKRSAPTSDDEEHAARLAERRERKRIKKAIVQPKEPSESDVSDEEIQSVSECKGKKGTKQRKPKIPAALALMHGFAATNVGKNRLTLKPGTNTGVFSKGKASENKQVYHPKPGTKKDVSSNIFCELKFLSKKDSNKLSSKPASERRRPPQSQNGSITTTRRPKAKKPRITNHDASKEKASAAAKRRRKRTHGSEVEDHAALASPSSSPIDSANVSPAVSEIWDIERDTSSLACSKTRDGTVLLNTAQAVWTLESNQATHLPPDDKLANTTDAEDEPIGTMAMERSQSSSLGPSESASQFGRPRAQVEDNSRRVTSKFFVNAKEPAVSVSPLRNEPSNFQDDPQDTQPFAVVREQTSIHVPTTIHRPLEGAYDDNLPLSPRLFLPTYQGSPSVMDSIDIELQDFLAANTDESPPRETIFQDDIQPMNMQYDDTSLFHCQVGHSEPLYDFDGGYDEAWTEEHCYSEQEMGFLEYDPDGALSGIIGDTYLDMEYCEEETNGYQDSYMDYDLDAEADYELAETYDSAHDLIIPGDITDEEEEENGIESLTQQFSQGRALLLGFTGTGSAKVHSSSFQTVSNTEADVAKRLKEHWLPQRL